MATEKLKTKVFESLGAASMCWSETPIGVFNDTKAVEIANHLVKEIELYAREMSIGFDFWKNSNYEPVEEGNYQGLYISKFFDGSHGKSHITPKLQTREELYNIYLESLTNK